MGVASQVSRRTLMTAAAALAGGMLMPNSARATPDFGPVTKKLQDIVKARKLKGAGAQLIRDNAIIYQATAGDFTPETVVNIASSSKWIAVATILTVVDEGKLSLDDEVVRYVPAFNNEKKATTLRHCLSCTAGLPSRVPGITDVDMTMEECVRRIAALPLQEPPGTKLRYGGTGFQVGAYLAELATGRSWYELMEERLTKRLGWTHTEYGLMSEEDGLAMRYESGNKLGADGSRTRNPWVAGSALSTLRDYGRLVQMLANRGVYEGRRVLSEAMVDEMFREQTVGMGIGYSAYPNDPSVRYGLGTWIERLDSDGKSLEVSDGGAFGWMPFIEFDHDYAGVFAVKDGLRNVLASIEEFQVVCREVLA